MRRVGGGGGHFPQCHPSVLQLCTLPSRKYQDSFEFSCESVVREICLQSFHENVFINFLEFVLEVFCPLIYLFVEKNKMIIDM